MTVLWQKNNFLVRPAVRRTTSFETSTRLVAASRTETAPIMSGNHRHNFRNVTDGQRTIEVLKKANGKRLTYKQPTGK
jgi:hypothetical protein